MQRAPSEPKSDPSLLKVYAFPSLVAKVDENEFKNSRQIIEALKATRAQRFRKKELINNDGIKPQHSMLFFPRKAPRQALLLALHKGIGHEMEAKEGNFTTIEG